MSDNILVSVNDAAVQRDDAGQYHITVGERSISGMSAGELHDMTIALEALMTAVAGKEDCYAEG